MSPEAQHEAVCKAAGHYLIEDDETDSVSLRHPTLPVRHPWHRKGFEQFAWENCPDFLSDLNAMHEAEQILTFSQRIQYRTTLQLVMSKSLIPGDLICKSEIYRAIAPQRAEAFLRTLNLWKDEV